MGFMILLYSINGIYISTNGYKSLNDVYKFKNVPYNQELVNFGTSHGKFGIYYGENNPIAFNYGLNGQIFYYDYALLNQYSDHFNDGCVVILPVSHFSFYQNFSELIPKQEARYYGILDPEYFSFTYGEYFRYQIFPVLSAGKNIGYIIKDKNSINEWEYENANGSTEQEIQDTADSHSKYQFMSPSGELKKLDNQSILYLEKMIKYCNDNGYVPVLVTTPVADRYLDDVPDEVITEFYPVICNISENYNITYLDYSNISSMNTNYSLFRDSNHLNLNGRKMFTKILISDLKERGLLDNSKDILNY